MGGSPAAGAGEDTGAAAVSGVAASAGASGRGNMEESMSERAALEAVLLRLGLELDDSQCELMLRYLGLLFEKNKVLNLTRIDSPVEALVLHIEDSLAVLPEFGACEGRFCDIGTGGGVPGIPLAIATGRSGVLLDSVQKKAAAVREFACGLGISGQVEAVGTRSELYAAEHAGEFGCVVARAVSSLPVVLELAAPLLQIGGRVVAMRAEDDDEMLRRGDTAAEMLGMELVSARSFVIGDDEMRYSRSARVYERVGDLSVKVPRRPGLAAKKPLA